MVSFYSQMKEINKQTHFSNLQTSMIQNMKQISIRQNINNVYIHLELHPQTKSQYSQAKHKPLIFKTNKSDMDDAAASSIINLRVKNKTRKCGGYISAKETI